MGLLDLLRGTCRPSAADGFHAPAPHVARRRDRRLVNSPRNHGRAQPLGARRLMAADPAPVAGFSATVDPQTAVVVVQWTDQAAPDATYQVYRSAGTFNPDDATLVGTTTPGGTTVDDSVATIPGADDGGVTYGLVPVDPNVAVPLQDGDGDLPPLDGVVTLQPVGFIPPVVMDPANAPKKASSMIVAGQAIVTINVPGAAFPGTGKPTLAGALNIATTGARTNPTVAPDPPAACPPGQVQFGSAVQSPVTGDWTVTVTIGSGLVTAGGQVWVTIGSSTTAQLRP